MLRLQIQPETWAEKGHFWPALLILSLRGAPRTQGFWSKAEQKIARMALDEGRGLIVALNKWDLIPEDERKNVKSDFDYQTGRLFPATRGVKMVAISALHMKRHFDLLDAAVRPE